MDCLASDTVGEQCDNSLASATSTNFNHNHLEAQETHQNPLIYLYPVHDLDVHDQYPIQSHTEQHPERAHENRDNKRKKQTQKQTRTYKYSPVLIEFFPSRRFPDAQTSSQSTEEHKFYLWAGSTGPKQVAVRIYYTN
jgi:hypothetical protein